MLKSAFSHFVLSLQGTEPRIILAAAEALRRRLCHPILLGPEEEMLTQAKQLRVDLSEATLVDPSSSPDLDKYVDLLVQERKHKVRGEV
jgi:phosphotransacetylase